MRFTLALYKKAVYYGIVRAIVTFVLYSALAYVIFVGLIVFLASKKDDQKDFTSYLNINIEGVRHTISLPPNYCQASRENRNVFLQESGMSNRELVALVYKCDKGESDTPLGPDQLSQSIAVKILRVQGDFQPINMARQEYVKRWPQLSYSNFNFTGVGTARNDLIVLKGREGNMDHAMAISPIGGYPTSVMTSYNSTVHSAEKIAIEDTYKLLEHIVDAA